MSDKPDLTKVLADSRKNMWEDLNALWKIWVPATVVNFAFMPMHARIPFVACVSLLWTAVLSAMRGGDITHGEDMAGGAVTSATLTMMENSFGVLFTSPVEISRDMHHVVVTASGLDKPGWVAQLSRAVADAGGNITDSRMVRLGSQFIVTMHVATPLGEHRKLIRSIRNDANLKPLNVRCSTIASRKTGSFDAPVMGIHVVCSGKDRYASARDSRPYGSISRIPCS